ncbi:hypothetical protein SARC_01041 [Sphaeroforma arctica JP610]|uniref:Uncharacterized protein n=1 Tax=Sphaeroforma arctica JP610 TaxID=667725 RepID=A0A0L0GEX2_9EUKA|nr:hypothetical protein SARC_01041 [Sphaeroforma arctica JP610]KNC86848.1 hypothetical protein SARC_01041 [Sphaeroforma arctica JP610]|eukprot:XP_014160750.1 hypothetical protein SARC_01041 [Sphaeroforma arctica JP610]
MFVSCISNTMGVLKADTLPIHYLLSTEFVERIFVYNFISAINETFLFVAGRYKIRFLEETKKFLSPLATFVFFSRFLIAHHDLPACPHQTDSIVGFSDNKLGNASSS